MSHGHHQYWRLLTSGFLHASIIHIGFNMLSLWFVGRSLEPAIGRLYFAAIYFTALLAGSFGALLVHPGVADTRRLGRDLRHLRRADHGRSRPSHPALAIRSAADPALQPRLHAHIAGVSIGGHLGGLLSGLRHWLAGRRVRREARSAAPSCSAAAC